MPARLSGAAPLAALAILTLQGEARAAGPVVAGAVPPAEVAIPNSRLIAFTSTVNHRRYSISIGLPSAPPPKGGYGVLYVLDGYDYFDSAVEAVRGNLNAPDVVVVGIGYPDGREFTDGILARHQPLPAWLSGVPATTAAYTFERLYDLTLPAADEVLAAEAPSGQRPPRAADVGGLDAFLETIERDVKPRVEALVPIDRSNQAIFGHSLGGLAVLHALFSEPDAFRTFVAASPSIWWGAKAVLRDEPAFAAAVERGSTAPRVLITVGGEEETPPSSKLAREYGMDPTPLAAMVRSERMIGNARDLTLRLQGLRGSGGYRVQDLAVFPDQAHGLSPWPAIGRAVAFAFSQPE